MRQSRFWILGLVAAVGAACGDDPTQPETCEPTTDAVDVTVSTGGQVIFDWEPACGVALLLVEEEASDQWAVGTDENTGDDPDVANGIEPPVTYGVVPPGTQETNPAVELSTGVEYEVILWRILPSGTATTVAVHPFTR